MSSLILTRVGNYKDDDNDNDGDNVLLQNVAINDVLPLKAARRDAIGNLKRFGAPGYQRPNFDDFICVHYAASPYLARISAITLLHSV